MFSASYKLKAYNAKTSTFQDILKGPLVSVTTMAFSPDGSTLAIGGVDTTIKLYDAKTGELKTILAGHTDSIRAITYSSDGTVLASASDDKTVKIWNPETGECMRTFARHSHEIKAITFSVSGNMLASASQNIINIWDANTGELKKTLSEDLEDIKDMIYSPDRKILTIARKNTVMQLDTATGEITQQHFEHFEPIISIAYSPDDSILASASRQIIKLWDTKTGNHVVNLQPFNLIRILTYSPDGKTLIAVSGENTMQVWDVTAEGLQRVILAMYMKEIEKWIISRLNQLQTLIKGTKIVTDANFSFKPIMALQESQTAHDQTLLALEALRKQGVVQGYRDNVLTNIGASACGQVADNCAEVTESQVLPHNGLFTRRNNEFGTKLMIGIKNLIEQGILIDQTSIRFDDFVAMKTDKIPLSASGYSTAVSYGISKIPASQQRDERATHYLEIALKTSDVAPKDHPKSEIPPVNYIFVIDTSGSMSGEKIETVKASIRELFKQLRPDDVIGVIQFDDQPAKLLKATPVKELSVSDFSAIISNLNADGGTDLNMGVSFGIDEISRYGNANTLNQVFLFSDGQPTSGETNWLTIRQNIAAKMRGNTRLSTFAYGSDANTRELDALAGLTGGKHTFIAHPDDIQWALEEELSRREHLAAINVQLNIEIDEDVDILYLYGHDQVTDPAQREAIFSEVETAKEQAKEDFDVEAQPDIVTQEKGIRIFVPDLALGETYYIVFELGIPETKQDAPIGKATVQYVDTFARENRKHVLELSPNGTLPPNVITQHALGLWTSEIAFFALDDLYEHDLKTAQTRIQQHISVLDAANAEFQSPHLADDIITLKNFVSLTNNLGRVKSFSEQPPSAGAGAYYMFKLNEFGRVRGGFQRMNYGIGAIGNQGQ